MVRCSRSSQQSCTYKKQQFDSRKKHGNYINFRKISIIHMKTSFLSFGISILCCCLLATLKFLLNKFKWFWNGNFLCVLDNQTNCFKWSVCMPEKNKQSNRWHWPKQWLHSIWLIWSCMTNGQRRVSHVMPCVHRSVPNYTKIITFHFTLPAFLIL